MFNNMGENTRLVKFVTLSFILLSCFLVVQSIAGLKKIGYIGKEIYPQRTIVASGEGEAYAIPDIATFSFGATETGDTVKAAQDKVDAKINKALDIVKAAGVDEKDIQTTNYSVNPKYEWNQIYCITTPCPQGKNVLVGYEVDETITVKVRDTSKAGKLITDIGTAGLNNISGLQFTVDDKDKYVAEARAEAITKAKANAEQMAKDLGVSLGKLLYFSENGDGYPIYAANSGAMDMKAGAIAPQSAQVPAGESKITSDISITYEIN